MATQAHLRVETVKVAQSAGMSFSQVVVTSTMRLRLPSDIIRKDSVRCC